MCYGNTIITEESEEYEIYKHLFLPNYARYVPHKKQIKNYYFAFGFDNPDMTVITDSGFELKGWGLLPHFATVNGNWRKNNLNAVGEKIYETKSFKEPILNKRCLLPVSGFFEWQHINKVKYPYLIKLKERKLFSLACIYDRVYNQFTGEEISTFSIVTTSANPLMETIHNQKKRMPLILSKEDEAAWIDPSTEKSIIEKLIKPYNEKEMHAYTVGNFINSNLNDRNVPDAIKPHNYIMQGSLF